MRLLAELVQERGDGEAATWMKHNEAREAPDVFLGVFLESLHRQNFYMFRMQRIYEFCRYALLDKLRFLAAQKKLIEDQEVPFSQFGKAAPCKATRVVAAVERLLQSSKTTPLSRANTKIYSLRQFTKTI